MSIVPIVSPTTCNGDADGIATVNPSGGTAPYTYSWSNAATTASITGVIAGTYNTTITDANGCTSTTDNDVEVYFQDTANFEAISVCNTYEVTFNNISNNLYQK